MVYGKYGSFLHGFEIFSMYTTLVKNLLLSTWNTDIAPVTQMRQLNVLLRRRYV